MDIAGELTVIYYDNGNGTSSQAGLQRDAQGKIFQFGAVPSYPIMIYNSQLRQWGAKGYKISINRRNTSAILQNGNGNGNNTKSTMDNKQITGINTNNPIVPVRTPQNGTELGRIETPANVQDNLTWRIILDNRAEAANFTGILGDPTNVIARQLAIPPPPPLSIIGGTFGVATIQQLKDFVLSGNAYVLNFQATAMALAPLDPADLWNYAPFKEAVSDLQGSVTNREMDFESMIDGSMYHYKYRLKANWKYIFGKLNGIYFDIPAGYGVTITLIVRSYSEAEIQNLVK